MQRPNLRRCSCMLQNTLKARRLSCFGPLRSPRYVDDDPFEETANTDEFSGKLLQATFANSEVDRILRIQERSAIGDHREETVEMYEISQVAANKPIEDNYSVGKCRTNGAWLFGVFDGHGGPQCSQNVAGRLFDYCCMAMLPLDRRRELLLQFDMTEMSWRHTTASNKLGVWSHDHHLTRVRNFFHTVVNESDVFYDQDKVMVRNALQAAFLAMDSHISEDAMPNIYGNLDKRNVLAAVSGTCACVAQVRGRNLHVANVGDSSAILGVRSESGAWTARRLVHEHIIDNPAEVRRIRAEHPLREADMILRGGRLLGQLFPLRAFGDVRYKWPRDLQEVVITPVLGRSTVPPGLITPPYLKAEPEVYYHRLTPHDKFLVIASDGLWDTMTPDQVVKLVADHIEGKGTLSPYASSSTASVGQVLHDLRERKKGKAKRPIDSNAATHLIRIAIGGENPQNQYDRLRISLSLPPDIARAHRDDITVIIVYFNSNNIKT